MREGIVKGEGEGIGEEIGKREGEGDGEEEGEGEGEGIGVGIGVGVGEGEGEREGEIGRSFASDAFTFPKKSNTKNDKNTNMIAIAFLSLIPLTHTPHSLSRFLTLFPFPFHSLSLSEPSFSLSFLPSF